MKDLLLQKIRKVTTEDWGKLPVFSYSKMEVFKNCPFQYDLKYNAQKYSKDTTIALELGSLCHYILEKKGKMLLTNNGEVDYNELNKIKLSGTKEEKDNILGINDLKRKYFDLWYNPDNASGKTYEEKMKVFDEVLHNEMENEKEWKPYLFEHEFSFVWDDRIILKGFIDRVDIKIDQEDSTISAFRVIDYKTSKKIYDKSKLTTSLQFGIYALAILSEFNMLPEEYMYRFILIDDSQLALTKGWEKRLIKALDNILNKIDECSKNNEYKPNPTPLCYWCNYSGTNPDAHQYKDECIYYSLWTPTQKTFSVNCEWESDKNNKNSTELNSKRRLIF